MKYIQWKSKSGKESLIHAPSFFAVRRTACGKEIPKTAYQPATVDKLKACAKCWI